MAKSYKALLEVDLFHHNIKVKGDFEKLVLKEDANLSNLELMLEPES